MTLPEYIREIGIEAFARKFRIKIRTATSYLYGDRSPRPKLAAKIVRETPVGWDGVYAASMKKGKRH